MEVLSSGVPIYVIDQDIFTYRGFKYTGCSSAPYFDSQCGTKFNNMSGFDSFLQGLETYNPRAYIIKNHTEMKSAENYIKLLKSCQ